MEEAVKRLRKSMVETFTENLTGLSSRVATSVATSLLFVASNRSPPLSSLNTKRWSGARDLNPGPHGPEPCRCRVLRCPTDTRVVLPNTESTRLVSFGDPLEPFGAGNA